MSTIAAEVHRHERCTVLSLSGELDVFSAPVLKRHLIETLDAGGEHLVLDLEAVPFMDSTSLGVLLGALKRYTSVDGTIVLARPQRRVQQVLDLTGVDVVIDICEDLADACTIASNHR